MKKTGQHVKQTLEPVAPAMQPRRPEPQRVQTRRVNAATRDAFAAHGGAKKDGTR